MPAGVSVDQPDSTPAERRFRWIYPFDLAVLLFTALAFTISRWKNVPVRWHVLYDPRYDQPLVTVLALFLAILLLIRYVGLRRAGLPVAVVAATFRRVALERLRDPAFYWEFARILLAAKMSMVFYSNLKVQIPRINPRLYDAELWAIDRALHLGLDPARLATAPLAHLLAPVVDLLYFVWYPIQIVFLVHFIFFAPRRRAWWFLTCWVLTWCVGIALAIAVPSFGPCYTHPELYRSLMTPQAHRLQAQLLAGYQALMTGMGGQASAYEGIAAFPSLHVGMAVLWALFTYGTRLFRFLLVYAVITEVGSFYLGWHYAVDGYASALFVLLIWAATRPFFAEPPPVTPSAPTAPTMPAAPTTS